MNPAPTASSVSDHGVWDIPTALGGYFLCVAWKPLWNLWSFPSLRTDGVWEHSYKWGNKFIHSLQEEGSIRFSWEPGKLQEPGKFHKLLSECTPMEMPNNCSPTGLIVRLKSYELSCRTKNLIGLEASLYVILRALMFSEKEIFSLQNLHI